MVLDIGGEGRHPAAWNLNPSHLRTCGPLRGQPIPRLLLARAEAIPLPDRSVSKVIVERTPLLHAALVEVLRIARADATIVLRHAMPFGWDPHRLAKEVLGGVAQQRQYLAGSLTCQETIIRLAGG